MNRQDFKHRTGNGFSGPRSAWSRHHASGGDCPADSNQPRRTLRGGQLTPERRPSCVPAERFDHPDPRATERTGWDPRLDQEGTPGASGRCP
jgi:hypothetical protein